MPRFAWGPIGAAGRVFLIGGKQTVTPPFTARLAVPTHVMVRQVDGESVLLNLNSERYFGLDAVGTRMWSVLTTAQSIQAAFDALLAEYEVGAEQLRQNLQELVSKLVENGLVEVRSG